METLMANNLARPPGGILDDAPRGEGVATVPVSCRSNARLICHCKPPRSDEETPPGAQPTHLDPSSGDGRRLQTCSRPWRAEAAAARDPFGDLPEELLPTILSKLDDVKQAARTSLLSRRWRHAWKHCPKLTLDIVAMCGDGRAFVYSELYVQSFINAVDEILRQRRGGAVEELELRFDESHLPQVSSRLDVWIRFAVSSRATSVRLLVWETLSGHGRYGLPLQLLDAGEGVSILRHIHLSSVSLKVPPRTQSIGFPNLKSLGLRSAFVSSSDLQHMLIVRLLAG
ncbi:hypothetical protein QYE76_056248 [Lolium multiflorum]|uniref:F-box domain-containing protein n=1 Tax=Lolium multiflorum TaxID=4521 RepID=A0AAD8T1U0_LOLMU|nr:hypothetical protein QYE76_056248 [Lolium multiflorum]